MSNRKVAISPMRGGCIENVSQMFMDPGSLVASVNYQVTLDDGYQRIFGYERFDGRPEPSQQSFYVLGFENGDAAISEGDIVIGTSTAQGECLIDAVIESGTIAGGDAAGYLILGLVSGVFVDGEDLKVGGVKKAAAVGTQRANDITDETTRKTYLHDAMETARADILDVGNADACEGAVLGVWFYNDGVYAFRNNAGSTACSMYKKSTTGWTLCDLGRRVAFTSGGTYVIVEGDTITGATSAKTAIVKRVILESGTWAGGDAAGRLILNTQSGAFQAENLDVGANANVATIAGNSAAQTLAPSGYFEFVNHNFYAGAYVKRMYGCDGVSKAFEWDGTTFVQIDTGMTADTPTHIAAHKDHLFLAFPGSAQHSDTGLPLSWSGLLGASEIGTPDTISGFSSMPGNVLGILCRNFTGLLYGTNNSDWDFKDLSKESGAMAKSIQAIGQSPYFLDDLGIKNLITTQEYGDFKSAVISERFDTTIKEKRTLLTCSVVSNTKGQYRLFFSDNTAIYMTIGKKGVMGFASQEFDVAPLCACQGEDSSGNEHIYFGASNGYVYRLDRGNNFDGATISASLTFPFAHQKSPEYKKRYHKLILETSDNIDADTSLAVKIEYSDSDPGIPTEDAITLAISLSGGGSWDIAEWDDFSWDGKSGVKPEAYISGVGTNARLIFTSDDTYQNPHTFYSYILHYSIRGLQR